MQDQDLLFYDVEVYKHDSFVVFKDINKKLVKVFKNHFSGIAALIKDKVLVGFNNHHYDDLILTYMIRNQPQKEIKALSDRIIQGEAERFKPSFVSLDAYQEIDVSRPSLKKIEGNMGRMILESSIPFDRDEPLNEEEFADVLQYCMYDVDMTIEVFKKRKSSYFEPKKSLVDMLGKNQAMRWNTTSISANILIDNPLMKWDKVRIPLHMWELVPDPVIDLWMDHSVLYVESTRKEKSITIEDFGCTIQFGFGGLHGANTKIKKETDVKLLDVTSMYPNIILILGCLGFASEKYRMILRERIAVKGIDDLLSDALKLILNSVYGNLNNQYSMLYNPMAALSVCIYGQIALYDLCRRIAPYVTLININTDGVAFIPHSDLYIAAYQEWEAAFNLSLEEKDFSLFVQKDVNNYIAVKGNKIITKGGDVNRYSKDAIFKNNNARILDIALVEFLVHGHPISETILMHLDKPHLFQYILKAGNTYKGTYDDLGNEYNKVNRVFAAKGEGICLFKKRHDDGLVKFADAPDRMLLWNEDCSDLEDFADLIDINHYETIIKKRLERWM